MTGYSDPKAKNLLFFLVLAAAAVVITILVAISTILVKITGTKKSAVLSFAAWVSNFTIRFLYEMLLQVCLCLFLQMALADPISENEA